MRQNDRSVSLDTPSHQSLLAYLVIGAQRVHSRQQLDFQFWPDSSESQARTNLRGALYSLRHILPNADCFLIADRQTVQWQPDAPCVVDAWDFETAIAQARQAYSPTEQQSCLGQAITAYHGHLLPGLYDDWVLATREKYRQQYLTALEKLLLLHEKQRQYPAAISLARKLLREDPLHEAAYRRLMRLQSLHGNKAGALRTYHACSTCLQRELGVDPSLATQETYERLLRMQAPPTPLAAARLPLVSREKAWQALQTAWKQSNQGHPPVVLLTGEAGIGKTRLAEEVLDWAERQGIVVLAAVCYASEKQLAYASVAKWLRSESLQPLFERLDDRNLVECSRLLPELNNQHVDLPAPSPLKEGWQRQHLFSALAQTLLKLRQPFLLFLDDLPWCDQDSLDFLLFLLHYDPQSRFLLLTSARSEDIATDHMLIPWQQQLDRDSRLTKITLRRLDAENSARLAGQVLKRPLDSGQASRLYLETEGNPLFVVEMARAGLLAQPPASRLPPLPQKVQAVIDTRLATLSHPAFELAQLASVIGHSFIFNLLNHACPQDEDLLIGNLDELWRRRIIRERGIEAYDFSHDKIRQVAYESLSQARRRHLHQRVWRALETLYEENLNPVNRQIAAHCEASGNYQEAIAYYHRAAQMSQAVYANRDTLQYLQRAIDLFSQVEVTPEQQIELYEQLGTVLDTIGRFDEASVALDSAISCTTDPRDLSRLYRSVANVHRLQRHYDKAHWALDKAQAALRYVPQTPAETWWQEWLQIKLRRLTVYYFANRIPKMADLIEEIRPIVDTYGTSMQIVDFYQNLALFGIRQERAVVSDKVVAYAQTAYDSVVEDVDDLQLVASTRFILALSHLLHDWYGDLDEAEAHFLAVLEMAKEMGSVLLRTRCLNFLAIVCRMRGDHGGVAALLPQVMAAVKEGNLQEYIATAESNLAWLKWLKGDMAATKAHGQKALAIWRTLPIVIPLQWTAIWPLIDVALTQNELAKAMSYAETLLPDLARLPDELTVVLGQAISTFANDQPETTRSCMQSALQQARHLHQL